MASDWDQRLLCPDGGCVGVIGPDGTCKTCGRAAPNWGDERRRGKRTTAEVEPAPVKADGDEAEDDELEDDEEYEDGEDGEDGDESDAEDGEYEDDDEDGEPDDEVAPDLRSPDEVIAAGDGPADFEQRKLCPDGSCIGVIGDNGRCRVCGKKGV